MAQNYRQALNQAKQDVAEIIAQMQKLDATMLATSQKAILLAGSLKNAGFAELNKAMETQAKLMKSVSSQTQKQAQLNTKLTKSRQNLSRATKKLTYEEAIRKTNQKEQRSQIMQLAKANAKLVGSYDKLVAKMKIAKKAYLDALTGQNKSKTAIARLRKEYKDLATQVEQANAKVKNATKVNKQNNFLLEVQKANERAVAKEVRLRAQAYGRMIAPMDKLIAKQKLSRNALENAIASGTKSQKEIDRLRHRYIVLTKAVQRATASTRKFDAANKRTSAGLGGAVRGFRNLAAAFGYAGAAFLAADLVKGVFNLMKRLQSLDFALKTITASTEDLTGASSELYAAQEFLLDISKRYGLDILVTTERFTKFLAAAKQSNLAFEDTTRIYESVSKASAVLGLRTDELQGVYLALEQMLSKGKITTEELRRQLGERLPGAFGIMAEAVGVSVSELDKMLKKGEVLSSVYLPKFAVELEKAYGIESVRTVDTLVASQERLQVAWIEFVRTVEGSENALSNSFKFLLDELTFTLNWWEDALGSDRWKNIQAQQKAQAQTFKEGQNYVKQVTQGLKTDNAITLLEGMVKAQREKMDEINASIDKLEGTDEQGNKDFVISEENQARINEYLIQLAELRGTTDAYTEAILNLNKAKKDEPKEDPDKLKALKGSLAWFDEQIALQEEYLNKTALTTEQIEKFTQKIKELKEERGKIEIQVEIQYLKIGENEKLDLGQVDLDYSQFTNDQLMNMSEAWKEIFGGAQEAANEELQANAENALEGWAKQEEQKAKGAVAWEKWSAQKRKEIAKGLYSTFGEFYDIDMSKFEFLIDGKENREEQYYDAAAEALKGFVNARLQQYDIEMQEAIRSRDLILNNELATTEQKEEARARFREDEAKIRTRRAKAEKEAALINILIDTAAAVAKTLAIFGPLGIPQIPVIIGLGAAQAALVAAQPLPKFAQGHLSGTHEGLAMINDAGRSDYHEVIKRKGGAVEVYKDRNQIIGMEKGDKVYKSISEFSKMNNIGDLVMMNTLSDSRELSFANASDQMVSQVSMMRGDMKATWKEVKKLAKRPINVNVNAKIEAPVNRKYV